VLALTACGSAPATEPDAEVSTPADADAPDAGEADANPDAAPPRCDPSKPLGTPRLLEGLNTTDHDYGAQLTADEKTIFFVREKSTGARQIFVADRAAPDAPFGPAEPLPVVNDEGDNKSPSPSGDGLTLYFIRDQNVYVATRKARNDQFSSITKIESLSTSDPEDEAYPTASGMFFTRNRPIMPSPHADIAYAPRRSLTEYGDHTWADAINFDGYNDGRPVVSADERHIFFYSRRPEGRIGEEDVFEATRASRDVVFSPPTRVPPLNSDKTDMPTWLSPDGCVLHMSSARPEPNLAGLNLYVAKRPL
jgi:Tol biopolymer transport system component